MKHSLLFFLLVVAGLWNAVLPATPPTSSVYPLHPSANGRYLLDASNAPFLIIGDAPHSILANLSNSDAVTYLTDRGQRGFNALWIELLCNSYTFGYGTEGTPNYGRDVNGNNPFTSTLGGGFYDLCIAGRRKCTAMPQSKRGHRKQTFIRQPFTYENL